MSSMHIAAFVLRTKDGTAGKSSATTTECHVHSVGIRMTSNYPSVHNLPISHMIQLLPQFSTGTAADPTRATPLKIPKQPH